MALPESQGTCSSFLKAGPSFAVGKGEEMDNYTQASPHQPWRYTQSIVGAQEGNLFQSWEAKKFSEQNDLQLES